jgi:hypothetical protein
MKIMNFQIRKQIFIIMIHSIIRTNRSLENFMKEEINLNNDLWISLNYT